MLSSLVALLAIAGVPSLVTGIPLSALQARRVQVVDELKESYDYIIVGGGTAGLTVGDRLSESGEYSVLVIEHGDFYDASDPRDRSQRTYSLTSVPQPGLNNRTVRNGMGFCVGGSSAVNGMAVMRGTEKDYNIWAELGNEGSSWDWSGMLPYFRKAIHLVEPEEEFAEDYHVSYDIERAWGQYEDTRVYASFPGGLNPSVLTVYDALKDVRGVTFPKDGHAGSQGVFWYPVSVDPATGQRSYSRTGHWDGLNRPNYDILVNARVNEILFDDDVASGVRFVSRDTGDDGVQFVGSVRANKEVVVSAGAIHTPQVLHLSGIGPVKLLEEAGIRVKVDLPGVGSNFQDHPIGPGAMFSFEEAPPVPEVRSRGPGGTGAGQGLVAFLALPVAAPDTFEDIADRYASLDLSEYVDPDTDARVLAGYEAQQAIYAREMKRTDLSMMNYIISGTSGGTPINLHITSRGTIKINTTDPQGDVIVDYRALSNPTDVDLMEAYLLFLRRLFTTGYFAEYNATEIRPGAEVEDLEEYIRGAYNPQGWHPIGTAAKMRREIGGVVDDELKVYGVKGLRVADASVMPTLISGTTQLTAYAIGEKAADLIKMTWPTQEEGGEGGQAGEDGKDGEPEEQPEEEPDEEPEEEPEEQPEEQPEEPEEQPEEPEEQPEETEPVDGDEESEDGAADEDREEVPDEGDVIESDE